ncbi:MAG: ABC transporter permease subunit [candidate division KSB1 bacterium]|nr:ABC transporter permease subunit [candidate division KSB1 bacterium]MDZ7305420.1 ABC transporter permease subunit [candidate division KSB1 bacterium]
MLPILIAKELKHNLLSFRFVAGLLFVLVVCAGSSLIFCKKFQNAQEEYRHNQELYKSALASSTRGLQALYAETIPLTKEPRLSSLFASGHENRFPKTIYMTPSAARRGGLFSGMNLNAQRVNYKLENYADFDLVFIVGIVLSFLAIVLSFDAISRDREDGTLKLQLSNAVPRTQVLLAKYLATLILLLVPIILGSLLSIIIIQLVLGRNIILAFPQEALLTGALGMIYLSLFVWMGLWMSSAVSKSSTSLALLLLLWTFAVVLFPYLGGMIAQRYHPVASKEEYDSRFQAVMLDFMRGAPKEMHEVMIGRESVEGWQAIAGYFDQCDNTMEQFVLQRFTELLNQARTAESINAFSPYSAFRQVVERVSNTGLAYHKKFFDAAVQYRHVMKNFIHARDLADPQSRHRMVPFPGMLSISNKSVDAHVIPRFTSPPRDLPADLKQALPFVAYLAILNIVFFLLSHFTFAGADVR